MISTITTSLIATLSDPDVDRRWQAAGELAQLGATAVEPILTLLENADWSVQHIAVWALGEIRDPRTVSILAMLLHHDHLHVRLSAARALEKFDTADSWMLLDSWRDRYARIEWD
jgi:HEAT repeat protein